MRSSHIDTESAKQTRVLMAWSRGWRVQCHDKQERSQLAEEEEDAVWPGQREELVRQRPKKYKEERHAISIVERGPVFLSMCCLPTH